MMEFFLSEKPQQHQRLSDLPDEDEEENLDREMNLGKISFAKHFLRKKRVEYL